MLETKDLILDKAKISDWKDMYHNVWSRPEIAKYTLWRVSPSAEDAKERILKTIEFQKQHDTYFVYEKASGKPIGFAGVEKLSPTVYEEAGICLGPDHVGKGYGKQILQCLIDYCKREYGATEFQYTAREGNTASHALARSMGFQEIAVEQRADQEDGRSYNWIKYSLKLQDMFDQYSLLQHLQELGLPKTEYWVVGGGAMVLHGFRPQTHDIDLGCSTRLADALERQGYTVTRCEDGSRKILYSENVELFENWLEDTVENVNGVPVVSVDGLVRMKKQLGRKKDLADIALIEKCEKREDKP